MHASVPRPPAPARRRAAAPDTLNYETRFHFATLSGPGGASSAAPDPAVRRVVKDRLPATSNS